MSTGRLEQLMHMLHGLRYYQTDMVWLLQVTAVKSNTFENATGMHTRSHAGLFEIDSKMDNVTEDTNCIYSSLQCHQQMIMQVRFKQGTCTMEAATGMACCRSAQHQECKHQD